MNNIVSLDEERIRRIGTEQWEALAYLANLGAITIDVGHDHPPAFVRALVGPCHAMRLCRADVPARTLYLHSFGRQALAQRLRDVHLSEDELARLRGFTSCIAARRDPNDEALAKHALVSLRGSEWTWRTELGRLVVSLSELGV